MAERKPALFPYFSSVSGLHLLLHFSLKNFYFFYAYEWLFMTGSLKMWLYSD